MTLRAKADRNRMLAHALYSVAEHLLRLPPDKPMLLAAARDFATHRLEVAWEVAAEMERELTEEALDGLASATQEAKGYPEVPPAPPEEVP